MIDSKLPIIGSGYDHAGRYATHALPHQEPPPSSAFVGARRVKTFHRENNQLRNRETTRSPFEALAGSTRPHHPGRPSIERTGPALGDRRVPVVNLHPPIAWSAKGGSAPCLKKLLGRVRAPHGETVPGGVDQVRELDSAVVHQRKRDRRTQPFGSGNRGRNVVDMHVEDCPGYCLGARNRRESST